MQEPTDKVERELKALIDNTLELRRSWERRRLEAENEIRTLDAKLTAYQTALKDYWENLDYKEKRDSKI